MRSNRIHVHFSRERKLYLSSSLSRYRFAPSPPREPSQSPSVLLGDGSHTSGRPLTILFVVALSLSHAGSLPFTHVITASIGPPPTMSTKDRPPMLSSRCPGTGGG